MYKLKWADSDNGSTVALQASGGSSILPRSTKQERTMYIASSLGRWSVATTFVPLLQPVVKEFKPLVIKQLYYETTKPKTKESANSADDEAQTGFTQENPQAITRRVETES